MPDIITTPAAVLTLQNVDINKLAERVANISRLRYKIDSGVICFRPMLRETPTQLIDDAMPAFLDIFSRDSLLWLKDGFFSEAWNASNRLMIAVRVTMAAEAGITSS